MPDSTGYYIYVLNLADPALESPEAWTEEQSEIVGTHFNYLKDLTEKGVLIIAGRNVNSDERSFGIVVFKAGSYDEAKSIVDNDPAVKNNVMTAKLHEFSLALLNTNVSTV